ncbi:hypothetical protein ASE55_10410 [Chryseobacterium sp. Leaf201]|nr:hypothetical protein ASE55_10410 [Chryseobacterium sp. Leaf201]
MLFLWPAISDFMNTYRHPDLYSHTIRNIHLTADSRLGVMKMQAIQPLPVDFDHRRGFNPNNYIKFANDNSDEI